MKYHLTLYTCILIKLTSEPKQRIKGYDKALNIMKPMIEELSYDKSRQFQAILLKT